MEVAINWRPSTVSFALRRNATTFQIPNRFSLAVAPSSLKRPTNSTIRATTNSDQVDFGGYTYNKIWDTVNPIAVGKVLLKFASSNFLPVALVSAVALGLADPTLGCLAHRYSLSKFCTFGIFFISGLKLSGREVREVAGVWKAGLFGLASILVLSPIVSKLIYQFPLAPREFVTGLAIFCCVPTTLSSGVALTQLVGGNSALALSLTVVSNLFGILTVPFWVSNLLATGVGASVPTKELFWSLVATLLLPLILGKVLRSSVQGVATIVDRNRKILSAMSTILLSLTPWMQVSKSRSMLLLVKPVVFLQAVGMGILVHLALLVMNTVAIQITSTSSEVLAKKENARALVLVCSQKALLISIAVIEQLGGALGEPGLLVLPCVATHINQVIIDSFLVNFWLHNDKLKNKIQMS
ncbi:unnamed protein product [Rhodiola kirilowii]